WRAARVFEFEKLRRKRSAVSRKVVQVVSLGVRTSDQSTASLPPCADAMALIHPTCYGSSVSLANAESSRIRQMRRGVRISAHVQLSDSPSHKKKNNSKLTHSELTALKSEQILGNQ